MPWVRLDDKFHSNPKVLEAGLRATGLYVMALSYCADQLTDGFVPAAWARSIAPPAVRDLLTQVGLWEKVDRGYRIPDFLDFNPTREEVLQQRADLSAKRSEAGKRGAEARWGHGKHGKPHGKAHGKPIATALANAWQSDGPDPTPTHGPSTNGSSKDQSSSLYPANSENDFNMISDLRESDLAGDSPFTPDLLKDVP